jgi:hypothetical protein
VGSKGDGVFPESTKAGKKLSQLAVLVETLLETQNFANVVRHTGAAGILGRKAELVAQYQQNVGPAVRSSPITYKRKRFFVITSC